MTTPRKAEPNVTVGEGTCASCDGPVQVKVSKKDHLYYVCPPPADGGCGSQVFARYDAADRAIARRIKKWRDPGYRARYLGSGGNPPAAPKARKPAPAAPVPCPPAPAPEAEDADARFRREVLGE